LRKAIVRRKVGGCPYCALVQVEVLDGDDMAYPLFVELDYPHLKLSTSSSDHLERLSA
jgi:hypothetical protein